MLKSLFAQCEQMRNVDALDLLLSYVKNRRPYLPNDNVRSRAGSWIASSWVKKFNDWSVATRCKHSLSTCYGATAEVL
jgi:hypothetical protein